MSSIAKCSRGFPGVLGPGPIIALCLAAALAACERSVVEPSTDVVPAFHTGEDGEEHSHGRYSHISWVPRPDLGTFAVEFTYQAAFRRGYSTCYTWNGSAFVAKPSPSCTGPDGRAGTGDIIRETIGTATFQFGAGAPTGKLHFLVTSTNPSSDPISDWIFAVALDPDHGTPNIIRQYSGSGPFIANNDDCCRVAGLRNPGESYGVTVLVAPGSGRRSAIANLPPIVNVPQDGVRTWPIPASSPDGHQLRWGLTTPGVAGHLDGSQPSGMSLDAATGVVSWDTNGKLLGLYWSNVTIEELDGTGAVVGRVAVDYLINLVEPSVDNNPPAFTAPAFCAASVNATIHESLGFTVTAADPDAGDLVTLVGSGIPAGATFNPPVPATPISAAFTWTPATLGPRVVTFIATDTQGAQSLCVVTINVNESVEDPPVADAGGPYSGDEGSPASFDGTGSADPSGGSLTYAWDFGDGNTGSGGTPSHTYADNGVYTVALTVTSSNGPDNTTTTTATIANVAPTVDAGPDASILVGSSFALSASFSDPGADDALWSYVIDWGDGTQSTGSVADQPADIMVTSGVYGTAGDYTVQLSVTDKDGGTDSDQLTLRVLAELEPEDLQACTPGFWSQNGIRRDVWPAGYQPTDVVSGLFTGAAGDLGTASFLEALEGYPDSKARRNTVEGASEILLRAAVAAVLNEASFGSAYPAADVAAIQADVNGALASGARAAILSLAQRLDGWNNNYVFDEDGSLVLDPDGHPVVGGSCALPLNADAH